MPTSASVLNLDPANIPYWAEHDFDIVRENLRPGETILASAKRLTDRTIKSSRHVGKERAWQSDAWEMYDLVGEQRFLVNTLASRLSQAKFYVGEAQSSEEQEERIDGTDHVEERAPGETSNEDVRKVLRALGGSPRGLSQILRRLCVNLLIPGESYIVGVPPHLIPDELGEEDSSPGPTTTLRPTSPMPENPSGASTEGVDLASLTWRTLSNSEITVTADSKVSLKLGEVTGAAVEVSPNDVFIIRVWNPHPRENWEADSPTRSNLPVLRELVGLTMHISAQIDSRLAGAGLLLIPASAEQAMKESANVDENDTKSLFGEALTQAMLSPIEDRSSAGAVVPLAAVVPDESVEKFRHLKFSAELDSKAQELREDAIHRLALGHDAPPELLLGTNSMNHWGAWLVREDVVGTHLEPYLALICDALTSQYLRPVLLELGYSDEEASRYEVWYDVSHLVARPNRSTDAQNLHEKGVITDEALRTANGFNNNDAPDNPHVDEATKRALELIQVQPHLIENVDGLVDKLRRVIADGLKHGEFEDAEGTPLPDGEEERTAAEREADQTDPIDEVPDQDAERTATENTPGIE